MLSHSTTLPIAPAAFDIFSSTSKVPLELENLTALVNTAAKFDQIRNSFKGAYTDMKNEQKSSVRGGQGLAYDQLT